MPHLALAVRRHDHPREERSPADAVLRVEHHGRNAVLAVVAVVGAGVVVAVGDRALVDVELEEPRATLDGVDDLLVLHAALFAQDHRQLADQARLVQRPIAPERAMKLPAGGQNGQRADLAGNAGANVLGLSPGILNDSGEKGLFFQTPSKLHPNPSQ